MLVVVITNVIKFKQKRNLEHLKIANYPREKLQQFPRETVFYAVKIFRNLKQKQDGTILTQNVAWVTKEYPLSKVQSHNQSVKSNLT